VLQFGDANSGHAITAAQITAVGNREPQVIHATTMEICDGHKKILYSAFMRAIQRPQAEESETEKWNIQLQPNMTDQVRSTAFQD